MSLSLQDILKAKREQQQTTRAIPPIVEQSINNRSAEHKPTEIEATDAEIISETPKPVKINGEEHRTFTFEGDLTPILGFYDTLNAVKLDSTLWNSLNLTQRLKLGHMYRQQLDLAAQSLSRTYTETEQAIRQAEAQASDEEAHVSEEAKEEKAKTFALSIVLNERQQFGVDFVKARKPFVYTGAAGTGKTTGCREIVKAALTEDADWLGSHSFNVGGGEHTTGPGVAVCSYTRRATANIRRALHADPFLESSLPHNIITIHKLLEYQPIFFFNTETGKDTMRFEPQRTASNPLTIKLLIIEEASMLGLDLWEKLYDALLPGIVIIFVGDINQLPPVFGKSIMNYALAQLPIVELTEVYRQALDSGIIVNAHRILKGETLEANKDTEIVVGKSITKAGQDKTARALGGAFFPALFERGEYDPEQDIILSPWNKQALGTNNLNCWISQFLGVKRNAMVYEVFAGRRTMYLAVGDRVMYEKRDGVIKTISHNGSYLGRIPQPAGSDLSRFGVRIMGADAAKHEDFDQMVAGYANFDADAPLDEEKKLQSSHVVTLELDDGEEVSLSAVGDFADQVFSLGYAITVHKAQGCEWRKVFLILHADHSIGSFLTRELLYTAVTRAKEKLIVIAKPDIIAKCVRNQSIKGATLEEKIQSINSGAKNIGAYQVTKPIQTKQQPH